MDHLLQDSGATWSMFAWPFITSIILSRMLPGLTGISENDLEPILPFYHMILRSYCVVNNLFYMNNDTLPLPRNLFSVNGDTKLLRNWINSGLLLASDLPLSGKKIDVAAVQRTIGNQHAQVYIKCCSLQQKIGCYLPCLEVPTCVIHPVLLLQMKQLLHTNCSQALSLTYWETKLNILPMEPNEWKKIFSQMLKKCKVTKFWDINFKILSRILATPVVLSSLHSTPDKKNCFVCGERAGLEHILL